MNGYTLEYILKSKIKKMKNTNKLNININKDDHNINDYLYAWSELGVRANKSAFHGYFQPEVFIGYIQELGFTEISTFVDYIPNSEVSIINQKCFGKIEENIFLSYTHLDKNHEDAMLSEVSFFFDSSKVERVNEILEEISEISIREDEEIIEETNSENLFMLGLSQNGFDLEYLDRNENFEDIEYYYEEEILKKVKKTIKKIKQEKKGLTIISGERGCGKTNLLSYISSKVKKNCIYIPSNLVETSVSSTDFIKFVKQNISSSILLIDDLELYLSQIYSKSNLFTNNLLQIVDGLQSDSLNLHIIVSANCSLSEIDKTLLESNNITEIIEIGKLSESKIEELNDFLGKKNKIKSSLKLSDVLKDKYNKNVTELGFK